MATVLLIHGIAADAEAWADRTLPLTEHADVVLHDRIGYGLRPAPEPYLGTSVEEQAEDVVRALRDRAIDEPVVAAGDGFGALVALDLAKRHRGLVAGLALREPPLFAFVPDAAEALGAAQARLREAVEGRGPAEAVDLLADPELGPEALARARAHHRAVFADVAGLATWPVTRRELRGLDLPVALAVRDGAPRHVQAAADALAGLLPDVRRVPGGDLVAAVRALL